MNPDSPVTLRQTSYRGVLDFHLLWEENGSTHEKHFGNEAEAIVEMAAIEERLRATAMAGQGLTVNPFGLAAPFITSKDVHFAALRLQPRGLAFRDAITGYVAAVSALQGTDISVADAAKDYAEASAPLKPFDVSLSQAVFEWVELKKQIGDKPLFEVLRAYKQQKEPAPAAQTPTTEPPVPVAVVAEAPVATSGEPAAPQGAA